MDKRRIFSLIEEGREELFQLLSSFIRINSVNTGSHGRERELAEHIHALCLEMGLHSELYSPLAVDGFTEHPEYMEGRDLGDRYNVTARWRGESDTDDLMLMGHTDTVDLGDLSLWERDPLSGDIEDGKIWGRGACDDKYALASVLFLIKLLRKEGFKPKKNILFTAYSDEELGGSHGALAAVLKYPCPHIVNIDGDEHQIWHCGSGGGDVSYRYHTQSSVDSALGAAMAIPAVIEEIERFGDRRRRELEDNPFYKGTVIPKTALRYMGAVAGERGQNLGLGEVSFEFYTDKPKEVIDKELSELEERLASRLLPMGIIGDGIRRDTRHFHYVFTDPASPDISAMVDASLEATGDVPIVCGACLSDLSVISKYGSSQAFGMGIGRDFGLEGGAHQPNEYVSCDSLVGLTKTLAAFIINNYS